MDPRFLTPPKRAKKREANTCVRTKGTKRLRSTVSLSTGMLARQRKRHAKEHKSPSCKRLLPLFSLSPLAPSSTKKASWDDRFIPNRDAMNKSLQMLKMHKKENTLLGTSHQNRLAESLLKDGLKAKVLPFSSRSLPSMDTESPRKNHEKRTVVQRHVPAVDRILDLPGILDDFYLNVLDWGANNVVCVALDNATYTWNADTKTASKVCEIPEGYYSSLKWNPEGSVLAMGTSNHTVELWDPERQVLLRTLRCHSARVGTLAWNGSMLTSGSRDNSIVQSDTRAPQDQAAAVLRGHVEEVCGLAWSADGFHLASGGNDNSVRLWDIRTQRERKLLSHGAAVKALSWCPFRSDVLATGAGTNDRHVRLFNSHSGEVLACVNSDSQVSGLVWSHVTRELLTSHGYSDNLLVLWKSSLRYPSLRKIQQFTGHARRILHMAASPDGGVICTAGADEQLRFWNVWEDVPRKGKSKGSGTMHTLGFQVR